MNKKIIWIEDEAHDRLSVKRNYISIHSNYEITLAYNTSQAENALTIDVFDAIIVDIRLPPGGKEKWNKIYNECLPHKKYEIMGINLIKEILSPNSTILPGNKVPSKLGIFTVEYWDALENDLSPLGLTKTQNYCLKQDAVVSQDFLDFIDIIVRRNG